MLCVAVCAVAYFVSLVAIQSSHVFLRYTVFFVSIQSHHKTFGLFYASFLIPCYSLLKLDPF